MERITQKDLENLVERINKVTNSPMTPYTRSPDGLAANINNYYLDYAYGGVKLVQMVNKHGGITEISRNGHGTKRELYNWMQAFLTGTQLRGLK